MRELGRLLEVGKVDVDWGIWLNLVLVSKRLLGKLKLEQVG